MDLVSHRRIEELINDGYDFDISSYFNQGFDLTKKEVGLFIGYTIVYYLIIMAAGFIPFANILISPPLIAGFYLAAHKVNRNEMLEFGDFFKGFDYFGQLVIQQLILGLIMAALIVPVFLLVGGSIAAIGSGLNSDAGIGLLGVLLILFIFIAVFYLVTSYFFAPMFVIFGNMQAWDSMEASRKIVARNFFPVLGLLLLLILLNVGGALLCFVGLLFTIPATYVISYVAFRDLLQIEHMEDNPDGDIIDHLVD